MVDAEEMAATRCAASNTVHILCSITEHTVVSHHIGSRVCQLLQSCAAYEQVTAGETQPEMLLGIGHHTIVPMRSRSARSPFSNHAPLHGRSVMH